MLSQASKSKPVPSAPTHTAPLLLDDELLLDDVDDDVDDDEEEEEVEEEPLVVPLVEPVPSTVSITQPMYTLAAPTSASAKRD